MPRLALLAALFLSCVIVAGCGGSGAVKRDFATRAARTHAARGVSVVGTAEWKDPSVGRRTRVVGVYPDAEDRRWVDYRHLSRRGWRAHEWPTIPWGWFDSQAEARAAAARLLAVAPALELPPGP